MKASSVILRVKRKRTDAPPGSIVVEGLTLGDASPSLADHLHSLNLAKEAVPSMTKRLRFTRVQNAAPVQDMLQDAGLSQHIAAAPSPSNNKYYSYVSGHAHKKCVVYDLLAPTTGHPPPPPPAPMGRDAVDARLLHMTLQYLQETGSVDTDSTVQDVFSLGQGTANNGGMDDHSPLDIAHDHQSSQADAVAMDWTYDYYMLGDENLAGSIQDGVDSMPHDVSEALILVPEGDQWEVRVLHVGSADEDGARDDEENPDDEGHYANSYPDEDEWDSDSDVDSEQRARIHELEYQSHEEYGGHLSEGDW